MKHKKSNLRDIFTVCMLALAFMLFFAGDGTWTYNATKHNYLWGEMLHFKVQFDTTGKDTSNSFNLGKYDKEDWTSYPFNYVYYLTAPSGGTVDSIAMDVFIDGTMDGSNWMRVDTMFINTTKIVDSTRTRATLDLNNEKYYKYRLTLDNKSTGSSSGCVLEVWQWLHQEEY